ncbi:OTU domain-containing protein 4 isoform X2 [Poecilia formosa]|uniref:OTU domain-containing protein 4 isoform X2 n=2 Tax=Poecilia TaxID=8080 RepID=UPI0007B8C75E|nr:PREDICTED: OTU domain-containing protein 4 isoform X2 [Poecilia formosa]
MDSGGNMQSNEERNAEKQMDNYLKTIGFHRKKIAKDGSCLFRAVAEQVLHCQSLHTEVRAKCVEFLKQNRDSYEAFIEGNFEEYLSKLQDPQQWVGEVEINALAVMYKRDFLIFQEPGKPAVNITDNNFKDKVRLCFLNGNHYDSVYPITHMKSAALCQSILYELLYEGVFRVDRGSLGPCQRTSRASDLLSDDCMAVCGSSDESDQETHEPLWVENGTGSVSSRPGSYRGRGRGRSLPERVRRSLNPTLLRNVDYDIWHKTKRAQQKMDYSIAAGMQFSVGDRCQVRLDNGRTYKATIKDVPPDNSLVAVQVEDLGKKMVPLWSIRPLNDENSWTTVTNRDKRLSNGHGEWEGRGRGRGRGKPIPASSSSVSQATAVGSSGRMLKQHSWPPQATVEEQGKPSRKSLSAAEPPVRLTERERLAREEEEINMALLEIQLRDENSFPALGSQTATQAESGRKKTGDKKRNQRNKTKSPVEDTRALSPSAGDRPNSSTPPPAARAISSLPAANADPAGRSSLNVNMAAAAASGSASVLPPTFAAPETKPNAQSYASAAAVPVSPPPGIKPPAPSSSSLFSFITPVLPAASPAPHHPPSSSFAASSPPSSATAAPTFIAPIAPSPTAAQGFTRPFSPLTALPRSPSPPSPSSTLIPPAAHPKEAPPAHTDVLPKTETSLPASQPPQSETSVPQSLPQVVPNLIKALVPQAEGTTQHSSQEIQTQSQEPQNQIKPEAEVSSPQKQLQPQTELSPEPQSLQPQSDGTPVHSPLSSELSLSIQSSEDTEPPKSDSPPPASQQSQPAAPAALPPLQPHFPQPIHGAVPLQQLSQLYQDPLFPGYPQGEKGEVAHIPPFSTSKSGDDLPKDVNVLRFFFNLGVKAYSMPMFSPYVYLFPLQQYSTMQMKPHAPSPHYPCSSPPTKLQEAFQPTPYPAPSPSPQYDHHSPPAEPPRPAEPQFNQSPYPVAQPPPPQRMPCASLPWPPPRNPPPCPVGYPSPPPPYSNAPPSSQGFHPGQAAVHPLYPAAAPYPPFSLGYQPPSAPEELQVSQAAMEQLQPANPDPVHSHGHVRVLGPLEAPPTVSMANANNNRNIVVTANYAMKKEAGEVLTRTVLLVDPPLNNKPILAVVSDPDLKDAALRSGSSPASPSTYRGARKHFHSTKPYGVPVVPGDPGQLVFPPAVGMPEPLSVACGTEDDFDLDPFAMGYGGQRKVYRGRGGSRGRSSYDPVRGRRRYGDQGAGTHFFNSSFRGRGRERGY